MNTLKSDNKPIKFSRYSKLDCFVCAMSILNFILTLHNVNYLRGFYLENKQCPLYRPSKWYDKTDLDNVMLESIGIASYAACIILSRDLPVEEQYDFDKLEIDPLDTACIQTLVDLCQSKYINFINRVASELYDNGFISGEDIANYFAADGGFDA